MIQAADLIRERTRFEWPESFRRMIGTWGDDFPDAEEICREVGKDIAREHL